MRESETSDVLGDLLDAARLTSVIHGELRLGAPWGFAVEASPLMHFYVVARGQVWVELAGARAFTACAGDVLLFSAGARHALRDAMASPCVVLNPAVCQGERGTARSPRGLGGRGPESVLIAGGYRFVAEGRRDLLPLPPVMHWATTDERVSGWLKPLVELMTVEALGHRPGASVTLRRLADVLLVQAFRALAGHERCKRSPGRALSDGLVGRALELMHQSPGAPWTVDGLAAKVGASRSGFAARFTSLVGASPLHYLARWRMTRASQLLRETDLPLQQIAQDVGYSSDAAFNKAFKRAEGTTPGRLRRSNARATG